MTRVSSLECSKRRYGVVPCPALVDRPALAIRPTLANRALPSGYPWTSSGGHGRVVSLRFAARP